jgi:hypothetical protein
MSADDLMGFLAEQLTGADPAQLEAIFNILLHIKLVVPLSLEGGGAHATAVPPPRAVNAEFAHQLKRLAVDWDELEDQKVIGEGNFGIVSSAVWRGTHVAVKTIKEKKGVTAEETAEAMREEACVFLGIGVHGNIVQLQGVVEDRGSLVLPLYKKGSVEDVFRRGERLSSAQKLRITQGASAGLIHMHAKRILHRDIAAR